VRGLVTALQDDAAAVDDCFRFASDTHLPVDRGAGASTPATADILNRMEQRGNDATFERFVGALRRQQRHLAAVLDDTRNQLRKRWRRNGEEDEDDEVDDDEEENGEERINGRTPVRTHANTIFV
jgi:hypothetical protein